MCGIIGIVGTDKIISKAISGLERLEYRGYDSAGLAGAGSSEICSTKTLDGVGNLDLSACLKLDAVIGHSRWATHGDASLKNAHPHGSGEDISIVHNGIIENHKATRERLQKKGYSFLSDTDTECIVHNIHSKYNGDWMDALMLGVQDLDGAYAIAMVAKGSDKIYFAKRGSPLIIGIGDGENYISSSIDGLGILTEDFIVLDDGEFGMIDKDKIYIIDSEHNIIEKNKHHFDVNHDREALGENDSYMMKEIEEQPDVIKNTYIASNGSTDSIFGSGSTNAFKRIKTIKIIACGTSYNAAVLGRYWIEEYCGIRCDVEVASELIYRERAMVADEFCVFISQSGETADIIAAMKVVKDDGCRNTLAICNTRHSEMVRLADYSFLTRAGVEIGVASTKAFTTQLIALLSLCKHVCEAKGMEMEYLDIERLVLGVKHIIEKKDQIKGMAQKISTHNSCLYIGRGNMYPIAMEGALKMKEISYIHAEAYAGGELKHGPIALIDEDMPVIALSFGGNDTKMNSNIAEIKARGGEVFLFDECGHNKIISPILMSIYMQILAYHTAKVLDRNIDKPRNLAKSVTVE